MPTYDYRCEKCGKFEHEQRVTEEPLKQCPKCGGTVKRLISSVGIAFKGSGFHVTDYKKDGLHETKPAGKLPDKKPDTKETSSKKN